jgi:hypothetical protein
MLKNAVGISAFYSEYAENKTYEAVAAALPFDIVGISTSFAGARGKSGEFSMAVSMLTSDEEYFKTASEVTENKTLSEITDDLSGIYRQFLENEKPKLVLSYMAGHANFNGDDLIEVTNKTAEGVLLFGSLAWNTDGISTKNYVTLNETASPYLMSFIAIYGDFKPCFQVATSLDAEKLIKEAALITDSNGAILKSVNNIPTLDYLRKIGVINEYEADLSQLFAVPAIIIYENGARAARAVLETAKDDPKSVLAAGNMPVGAKISFALMDTEETIRSASEMTEYFEREGFHSTLNHSCAARSWSLGSKYFAELETYAAYYEKSLGRVSAVNYILCYSGAEICPVLDKDGKFINCLHNYSLITCVFN